MSVDQLIYEMNRLYDTYQIDKNRLNELSNEQIVKEVKGFLVTLDKFKTKNYTDKDLEVIKSIYFFFC